MYDIAIIGSGPGGYRAAILAALRKQKVAIIEKHHWGGCCLNRGCVPKKAWHHSANLLLKNNHLQDIGIKGALSPDFTSAWQHQHKTVLTIRGNYLDYMKRLGIQIFEGHGQVTETNTINIIGQNSEVKQSLDYKNLILATGSSAFIPELFNIKSKRILTTDDLFETQPPQGDNIAIIGGGVIAVEFAFILHQLGKSIQWFARSDILNRSSFSPQAIKLLKQKLADMTIQCQNNFPSIIRSNENNITLSFDEGDEVQVDWLLLATGRKPNSADLGLDIAGIDCDQEGFIKTDEYLQTSKAGVYAIGDVRSRQMTANQAIADADIAIENIINHDTRQFDESWVPQSIYSRLELSRVGMDEDTAEDEGYEPAIGFAAFESSPAALGQHDTEGFIRLISDMDSGKLLGGEIIGHNAGEMIHLLSGAPDKENALQEFAKLNVNHPSRSEELQNATETLASKWGLLDIIYPKK